MRESCGWESPLSERSFAGESERNSAGESERGPVGESERGAVDESERVLRTRVRWPCW